MNREELFEVLEDIDPLTVKKARNYSGKGRRTWIGLAVSAACLVLIAGVLFGTPLLRQKGATISYPSGVLTVLAAYPEPVAAQTAEEFYEGDAHWEWWSEYMERFQASAELQPEMEPYYTALMAQLLPAGDENTVCSPLNTYIAFSMLAEVTDGETRAQLLTMLSAPDLDALRDRTGKLWQSNYVATPVLTSLLANSMWLNKDVAYNENTLKELSSAYFASSFRGTPGSPEMDEALRTWTDSNTGGLLQEYTKDLSLDSDTVLTLLSTIYYKATWSGDYFNERRTDKATFHGTLGDADVDMMHRDDCMSVFRSDAFTSVGLPLQDSGSMFFLLPDENTDVNALASDPDLWRAIRYDSADPNRSFPMVHLSIPKFRVSGKTDLLPTVASLGATDVLDSALADFTPLAKDADDLYLSGASHAALVEIDEKGVTGAAYTELEIAEGAMEALDEIVLTFDRPFLFVITGRDDSILFAGVVRNIE